MLADSRRSWHKFSLNSGKKQQVSSELDKWGRPVLKRVLFFQPDRDIDAETGKIRKSAAMFAAKMTSLPKEDGLAAQFRKFEEMKQKQRLKIQKKEAKFKPNEYLRELLLQTLSPELLKSMNIEKPPVDKQLIANKAQQLNLPPK